MGKQGDSTKSYFGAKLSSRILSQFERWNDKKYIYIYIYINIYIYVCVCVYMCVCVCNKPLGKPALFQLWLTQTSGGSFYILWSGVKIHMDVP